MLNIDSCARSELLPPFVSGIETAKTNKLFPRRSMIFYARNYIGGLLKYKNKCQLVFYLHIVFYIDENGNSMQIQ